MAEPPTGVDGLPPAEGAWRLARSYGAEAGLQAFREAHPIEWTPEAMAEALRQGGVRCRAALLAARDLRHLQLPALVQVDGGGWVVLRKCGRRSATLEGRGGVWQIRLSALAPHLTGHVLEATPEMPEDRSLWGRVICLLGTQRTTLLQVAAASVVLQFLALVPPKLTAMVMNRALPDGATSTLHLVAAGMALVALFQAWTGWIRDRALLYVVTRLEVSLQDGLLDHLLRLPFSFLQSKTTGELMQALGGLTNGRELFAERAVAAILDGLTASAFLVAMVLTLPGPTAVVALVAVCMAGLAALVGRAQARLEVREVQAQARQRGYLAELVAGIATVKAAGAEGTGLARWIDRLDRELGLSLSRQRAGLWSEIGLEALRQGLHGVLLVWGGSLVLGGTLDVGTLFAFVQLSSGFLGAVLGLVSAFLAVSVLRPQLAVTEEVLARRPEPRSSPRRSSRSASEVVLEDVWFRYDTESPWILRGLDLRVRAGQKHALGGPSGCGKSTILRLAAGLLTPERGSVLVGGRNPRSARGDVLYLPQFVQLHGGTILENLRMLSGGAALETLLKTCRATGLHDFVGSLPMNYSTVLPNGGRTLSGGQRQLIALTAAIASGRSLLLLDEALANVDPVASAALHAILASLPATTIWVQHDRVGHAALALVPGPRTPVAGSP